MFVKSLFSVFCLFFLLESNIFSQVVINEIQAAPEGEEPEWIELYNYGSQPVKMTSPAVCDAVSSKSLPAIYIPADSYVILTKDTTTLLQCRAIPKTAILLEAKLPLLNNDQDLVILKNNNITIDSICYNMSWGKKGISLERKDCMKPGLSGKNLLPSQSPDSATAGYANSVSPLDFDLSSEFKGIISDSIVFRVINCGRNKIDNSQLDIYLDRNNNSIFEMNELYSRVTLTALNPGEVFQKSILVKELKTAEGISGNIHACAIVSCETDKNHSNDTSYTVIYIPYLPGTVKINEILFDVSPGHAEFVELYNSSDKSISPEGWTLFDGTALNNNNPVIINSKNAIIQPGGYFVVAWDSAITINFPELIVNNLFISKNQIALNSDEDLIILKDPAGIVQDSVLYSSKWHSTEAETIRDRSLEKYNENLSSRFSSSWSTCGSAKGATPGLKNSIAVDKKGRDGTLSASPNPFSPSGSKNDDGVCLISYLLPYRQAKIKADIYDIDGNKLRNLLNNEFTASEGSFVWDGRNDQGYRMQAGGYVLLLEAVDAETLEVYEGKLLIVVGN